jgi:uncharacterized protein YcfJ
MKKTILTCLVGATLLTAQAQLFSPESLDGAFLGSLIGGIAGSDCRHGFSGNGAAIGAGVGLIAGALAGEARRRDAYYDYYDSPAWVYAPGPVVSIGYGYGHCGNSAYVYYSPNRYCAPGYYYRPTRPNYAVSGTVLGAASGALIGAGTHDPGKGAAIGAAAGLVLGGVAEASARSREQRTAPVTQAIPAPHPQSPGDPQVQPTEPAPTTPDAAPKAQDASRQVTSLPGPTSTYHRTAPPPQIPDAPRVPDAPRF